MSTTIDKSFNGRAHVHQGQLTLFPHELTLMIWPQIGLVQLGNGLKFPDPVALPDAGKKVTFVVGGEYEVAIKRVAKRDTTRDGIINLASRRRKS